MIVCDLSKTKGIIEVNGKDANSFLQGQLTCDIQKITNLTPGLGAFCNLKGRIRALFCIFKCKENYYLQLPLELLPYAMRELNKYARFSKVTLENVSDRWQSYGISIPEASYLPDNFLSSHSFSIFHKGKNRIDNGERYEFIVLQPANGEDLALESKEVKEPEYWQLLDILAGIPEVWPETKEQLLPHSLNLPALNAVSFNKGCYCGQEIIARMEHRATLKRHLYRATLEDTAIAPAPGLKLQALHLPTEDSGTIISAVSTKGNKIEMLVEALDTYAETSNMIYVNHLDKQIPVVITKIV